MKTLLRSLIDALQVSVGEQLTLIYDESGEPMLTRLQLSSLLESSNKEFRSLGIKPETRIGVFIQSRKASVVVSLCSLVHATCVPLNPDYTPDELADYLDLMSVDVLLVFKQEMELYTKHLTKAKELRVPSLSYVGFSESGELLVESLCQNIQNKSEGKASRDSELKSSNHSRVAIVLHTSGSTSRPKVVPLSEAKIIASTANLAGSLNLSADDCCLNIMPLFHVGGLVDLLLAPILKGGTVICSSEISTDAFFLAMKEASPTWYQGVPTMLRDIVSRWDAEGGETSQLRFIRSVSSPLSPEMLDKVEATCDLPVIEIYGMTETCGVITSNPLPPAIRKKGSVGVSVGPEVAVVDDLGNRVPQGQVGQVVVRGENVMEGYEGISNVDNKTFLSGWLCTGDQGYLDKDGYLFLTGRLKEMINRGGEKITPLEIDRLLEVDYRIKEAAAFSFDHVSLGEEVAVAVVLEPGCSLSEREVVQLVGSKLASFKVPKKVLFVDQLPRNRGGKLKRFQLSELINNKAEQASATSAQDQLSPLGKKLYAIWCRSLGLESLSVDDSFFELGGDSLKAVSLSAELEKTFRVPLDIAALFDHQSLKEFEPYLQSKLNESGATVEDDTASELGLPEDLYSELKAFSLAWRGERSRPNSLVVGHRTLSSGKPLFWCIQSISSLEFVADNLPSDRPIYGMRTLFKIGVRSDDYNDVIAQHYAEEINSIQPEGSILLGGFCEGGKISIKIARCLMKMGRKVERLLIQEYCEPDPEPLDCDIVYYTVKDTIYSADFYYHRPNLGYSKFVNGRTAIIESSWDHKDYYADRLLPDNILTLERGISGDVDWLKPEELSSRGLGETYDGTAQVTAKAPFFWTLGEEREIEIELTNPPSECLTIEPTAISGLSLGYRWLNLKGEQREKVGESVEITDPILPGESLKILLKIRAPQRQCRRILEISLVEEGIKWIPGVKGRPARTSVRVLSVACWLRKLLPLAFKLS